MSGPVWLEIWRVVLLYMIPEDTGSDWHQYVAKETRRLSSWADGMTRHGEVASEHVCR